MGDHNDEQTSLLNDSNGLRKRSFKQIYSLDSFFRKQDLATVIAEGSEERGKEGGLKKTLSIWDLIFYGLAATLGTGIFVTVGKVANAEAGPSIVFSFLLAGFASLLSALCYSEFSSRIPVSGSAYSFAYISLGEVVGWFIGWNLTLEYAISASAVAGGWTTYFTFAVESLGGKLPYWLETRTINAYISISPLSFLIIILCTLVLLFGMKESATFNLVVTIINILIILFFIIFGAFHVDKSNLAWDNFFPYGVNGTWRGVGIVFFSYIGFDSVSTLAAEVKKPKRDLPIGIIGTLLIVTLFYVAVSLVITGMIPYYQIDINAPLASAFKTLKINWAAIIISIGSVTTITATTLASLVGQPRIFYQMASDGLMFSIFGKTNSKGIPVIGTIITGLISAVIALFFDLNILLDMISIGTLLAFTVVCAGVIVLRYRSYSPAHPERTSSNRVVWMIVAYFLACALFSCKGKLSFPVHDSVDYFLWFLFGSPILLTFIPICFLREEPSETAFKTPWVPFIPCLGILMNVWFIMSLSLDSIIRLLIWTSIGMCIYIFYGIRHSRLGLTQRTSQLSTQAI
eukprot:TRINITY_DN3394_c0_g1_i1.p1 TRINITY_DN3394_c0_g1~~TRINITY_DN3394_c0_g1_i1.p1  ORF type:complete len:573 (+),score=110.26 TRINITY_DN3394_c0_g1_i1:100-1818(+)